MSICGCNMTKCTKVQLGYIVLQSTLFFITKAPTLVLRSSIGVNKLKVPDIEKNLSNFKLVDQKTHTVRVTCSDVCTSKGFVLEKHALLFMFYTSASEGLDPSVSDLGSPTTAYCNMCSQSGRFQPFFQNTCKKH